MSTNYLSFQHLREYRTRFDLQSRFEYNTDNGKSEMKKRHGLDLRVRADIPCVGECFIHCNGCWPSSIGVAAPYKLRHSLALSSGGASVISMLRQLSLHSKRINLCSRLLNRSALTFQVPIVSKQCSDHTISMMRNLGRTERTYAEL